MLDIIWNAVEDEYLTVIMYLLCSIPMRFSGKTSQMIHNVCLCPSGKRAYHLVALADREWRGVFPSPGAVCQGSGSGNRHTDGAAAGWRGVAQECHARASKRHPVAVPP